MTDPERWLILGVAVIVAIVFCAAIVVLINTLMHRRIAKQTNERINRLP